MARSERGQGAPGVSRQRTEFVADLPALILAVRRAMASAVEAGQPS